MSKKYVVTPKGISLPSMTHTNAMGKGEVCTLLNKLKKENAELKKGISDLQAYNGDQEEMSNIFARLKKLEASNEQGEQH